MFKKVLPLLITTMIVVAGCAAGGPTDGEPEATGPHASPENLVMEFYDRVENDSTSAIELYSPEMRDDAAINGFLEFSGELGIKFSSTEVLSVNGDTVKVKVMAEFEGESEESTDTFRVEEIDGEWFLTSLPE